MFIYCDRRTKRSKTEYLVARSTAKGQNEFMRSSFLPKCKPKITRISALITKQTRIVTKKTAYTHQKITKTKCQDPCLFGMAEILVIFGLPFGRNDDLINSF